MPTGYTGPIIDEGIDFRTYALRCARAFGACVDQRDERMDKPPELQEPSPYHLERWEAAKKELEDVRSWSEEDIVQSHERARQDSVQAFRLREEHIAWKRGRYEAMLEQVDAWQPPSEEHVNLKKFMREQIVETIDHDCFSWGSEEFPSQEEWHAAQVKSAERNVEYHEQKWEAEVELTRSRNEWISLLYSSLDVLDQLGRTADEG